MTWKEAIIQILKESEKPLTYSEISERILANNLIQTKGKTPEATVSAQISLDKKEFKEQSIFLLIKPGLVALRSSNNFQINKDKQAGNKPTENSFVKEPSNKFINNFGIYWNRNFVDWRKNNPDLLGKLQTSENEINFKDQIGIYLLYDSREIIYVGQAIQRSIAKRLKEHTLDRLSGRWDRFSCFGFYPVSDNGVLNKDISHSSIRLEDLGDILEAILIESIEPRQNRKQGNSFQNLEYLQQEDPEIRKHQLVEQLLKQKF